jgi:hypothetical protein
MLLLNFTLKDETVSQVRFRQLCLQFKSEHENKFLDFILIICLIR